MAEGEVVVTSSADKVNLILSARILLYFFFLLHDYCICPVVIHAFQFIFACLGFHNF